MGAPRPARAPGEGWGSWEARPDAGPRALAAKRRGCEAG